MSRILVVEDDEVLRNELIELLRNEGYEAEYISTFSDTAGQIIKSKPDLVLLDINIPELNGELVLRKLRKEADIPVIMVTSRTSESDEVLSMSYGADDFITKPYNPFEVSARVKSQLRRYMQLGGGTVRPDVIRVGGIELDDKEKSVMLDGEPVALTPTEYEILKLLIQNPGQVFSPKEIYTRIWNDLPLGSENTVAVHIRHLREKLEINPAEPRYLKVVWGQGYKCEKQG